MNKVWCRIKRALETHIGCRAAVSDDARMDAEPAGHQGGP
jgi:hypothetical protein